MEHMPSPWLTQVDSAEMGEAPVIEQLLSKQLTVKHCYNLLLSVSTPPPNKSKIAWEMNLDISIPDSNWKTMCLRYKQFLSRRIGSMYLKLIHRCYSLNATMAKWYKQLSPLCSFCNTTEETWVHLLWECERVTPIWNQSKAWCQHFINSEINMDQNACLILGFKEPVLNTIVTLIKRRVLLAKIQGVLPPSWRVTLIELLQFRGRDLNAFSKLPHLKMEKFNTLWHPIHQTEKSDLLATHA